MPRKNKRPADAATPSMAPAETEKTSIADIVGTLGVKTKAAWNAIMSLGPRALTLWPAGSKNMLRHDFGKKAIDGWKKALDLETKNYASVEKELLEQVVKATPGQLVDIEQKLEFLREKRSQTGVVRKSLDYIGETVNAALPEPSETRDAGTDKGETESTELHPVSDYWIDHFNRLARQRNEPWRAELLARALAAESRYPGAISPEALWAIGMLEEIVFRNFAFLLNLCATVAEGLVIPGDRSVLAKKLKDAEGKATERRIGEITLPVHDADLISLPPIHWHLKAAEPVTAQYGRTRYVLTSNAAFAVQGIMLTRIGKSLSRFHPRKPTQLGEEIFEEWLAGLDREIIQVERR